MNQTNTDKAARFAADLASLVPNWEVINTDPNFAIWLNVTDDDTGYTRKELVENSVARGDYEGTARMFKRYLNDQSKASQTQSPTLDVSPDVSVSRSSSENEGMIEVWTVSEIQAHYQEKQKHKRERTYSGATMERIEKRQVEIDKARAEGRIVQG